MFVVQPQKMFVVGRFSKNRTAVDTTVKDVVNISGLKFYFIVAHGVGGLVGVMGWVVLICFNFFRPQRFLKPLGSKKLKQGAEVLAL
jgi:hypothetical protein